MNKRLGLYLVLSGCMLPLIASKPCGSRTIFVPRSITTDSTYELALTNYHFYHNFTSLAFRPWVDFYVTPFYQKSRNKRELARFFLPNNKESITVREDGTGDVGSLFLELIAPQGKSFNSRVRIRPHRKTVGAHFNTYFNLGCLAPGAWFSIAFAAVRAEHNLCLREVNNNGKGTLPGLRTAREALNNPDWRFGRFSRRTLKRTGVDDVELKLGYDCFDCDFNHIGLYLVGTAPTGRKRTERFIFDPRVGSRHGSFGVGVNGDVTLWQECDHNVNFMFDVKYRYVFAAHERRSFDLRRNGDWSRFLLAVRPQSLFASAPGINFLTRRVKVTPRSTIDFWTAFHYAYCQWNVEVGYNLFWRQREKVCFSCPFKPGVGIFDLQGQCTASPTTSSRARISQSIVGPNKAPQDAIFTPIIAKDLNLSSGTHPRALTHKVYGAFSYNDCICSIPVLLGFGGSFEFARPKRNAFEQWAVWGKVGISF